MNNPAREDGSRFDSVVARYYPAVYSFAARLTDNPREASDLARAAFRDTRQQLARLRNQTAIATILISAVIRSGLGGG
jgi:DNA-directed RNA polymerase specialized sigma24 family protein